MFKGGCPGLVVMGADSCSEGHRFDSQHSIMHGHFSHIFEYKKRPRMAHFFKKITQLS